MSSSQNNVQTKKMSSIARRLAARVEGRRFLTFTGTMLFACLLAFFLWITSLYYSDTGSLPKYWSDGPLISFRVDLDVQLKFGRHGIDWINENLERTNRVITVVFKDTDRTQLAAYNVCNFIVVEIAFYIAMLVLAFLRFLISISGEIRRTREILSPLYEIANRADELAKLDFSDEKFHMLEQKITKLDPEDSLKPSNDKDLMGLENAINSLLSRMREANMQQARFVNDASHELRTPIAVIEGYANMLARWGREDEAVLDESITAITNESAHMKYLVEQLLFLARGDSGKTVLHYEESSLTSMMREIYEESLMIDEKHVYRFSAPEEDIVYPIDLALLKQAVRILVDNAAKYTAEKDEISLSVGYVEDEEGKMVPYLQVQDSGIGMAEADVAHMFERFYRSDEVRSYKGTGLGLSIAKWIVDKHKGHFEILSRTDLGTRIRIVLQ